MTHIPEYPIKGDFVHIWTVNIVAKERARAEKWEYSNNRIFSKDRNLSVFVCLLYVTHQHFNIFMLIICSKMCENYMKIRQDHTATMCMRCRTISDSCKNWNAQCWLLSEIVPILTLVARPGIDSSKTIRKVSRLGWCWVLDISSVLHGKNGRSHDWN